MVGREVRSAPRPATVVLDDDGLVTITGVYCDSDTGRAQWLAVGGRQNGGDGEKLVPVWCILCDPKGHVRARIPASAVWRSPTLCGAPEEICDCTAIPLVRHYADAVNPIPDGSYWPAAATCPSQGYYRAADPTAVLTEYLNRQSRSASRSQG
jgi:hypothetical protein